GALGAVVAVGHVVGDGPVLGAERDALAGLVGGAHGAGGAVRIPVGDVPGHGARGLRGILHRVALALDPLDHLATNVVAVDAVADHAAGRGAGHGGQLAALAAANLVADQAADHGAGHGAADVAVALGQALLHHHVLAHLARRGRGRGLVHRLGAEHGRVQLGLLRDRGHRDHRGVVELVRLFRRLLHGAGLGGPVAAVVVGTHGDAAD